MSAALPALAALLLGIVTVFGFAPFGASALPVLTLAGLFALWWRAATPRAAAALGFAFGVGLFGAGVSWVFVGISTFGHMPAVLAAIGTAGFCAYLALLPALAGWVTARLAPPRSGLRLALAAAVWVLTEWLRGWVLSGFGWLSVGYAQLARRLATRRSVECCRESWHAAIAALPVHAALDLGRAGCAVAIAAGTIAAIGAIGLELATIEWSRPRATWLRSVSCRQHRAGAQVRRGVSREHARDLRRPGRASKVG
jgi:apolipoprotein N-acyltransferase